jgi:hypothetical protein
LRGPLLSGTARGGLLRGPLLGSGGSLLGDGHLFFRAEQRLAGRCVHQAQVLPLGLQPQAGREAQQRAAREGAREGARGTEKRTPPTAAANPANRFRRGGGPPFSRHLRHLWPYCYRGLVIASAVISIITNLVTLFEVLMK